MTIGDGVEDAADDGPGLVDAAGEQQGLGVGLLDRRQGIRVGDGRDHRRRLHARATLHRLLHLSEG